MPLRLAGPAIHLVCKCYLCLGTCQRLRCERVSHSKAVPPSSPLTACGSHQSLIGSCTRLRCSGWHVRQSRDLTQSRSNWSRRSAIGSSRARRLRRRGTRWRAPGQTQKLVENTPDQTTRGRGSAGPHIVEQTISPASAPPTSDYYTSHKAQQWLYTMCVGRWNRVARTSSE